MGATKEIRKTKVVNKYMRVRIGEQGATYVRHKNGKEIAGGADELVRLLKCYNKMPHVPKWIIAFIVIGAGLVAFGVFGMCSCVYFPYYAVVGFFVEPIGIIIIILCCLFSKKVESAVRLQLELEYRFANQELIDSFQKKQSGLNCLMSCKRVMPCVRYWDDENVRFHANLDSQLIVLSESECGFDGKYSRVEQQLVFFPDILLYIKTNYKHERTSKKDLKDSVSYHAIPYRNLNLHYESVIETGVVSTDSVVYEQHWKYATKNGDPDLRYKDNPLLGTFQIGKVTISATTPTGAMSITIKGSDPHKTRMFYECFAGNL